VATIQLKNLTKVFGKDTKVIKNLNLDINDGEFLVLVGPSGCGKSTTLRIIAGLEEATGGEVYIDDKCVNNVAPKDRDIAMVFQNYALYPHMTVYDNMAFGLKLRKYPKDEIKARVHEAAEILELTDFLNRKPKQLSGGQRQRVALGRAIVRKPKVFLFDEPLSNLDAKLRVLMRTEIKKLHRRLKVTTVYVTHDQVEAMTMGDRISVMQDGIIHQVDDPIALYHTPNDLFVAGFIGNPTMNFIRTILTNDEGLVANEGNVQISIPASHRQKLSAYIDKEIVIGIRPEYILLEKTEGNLSQVNLMIEVTEPLGNEVIIYFTTGKTPIICRTPILPNKTTNGSYPVFIDMDHVHFFDPESRKSI